MQNRSFDAKAFREALGPGAQVPILNERALQVVADSVATMAATKQPDDSPVLRIATKPALDPSRTEISVSSDETSKQTRHAAVAAGWLLAIASRCIARAGRWLVVDRSPRQPTPDSQCVG